MIKYLFSFLLISALLFSCDNPDPNSHINSFSSVLPSSTGGADEIMFVIPDQLYISETKQAINMAFDEVYRILPQEESRFTLSKVKFSAMNNLMYRFRNIVLVANTSEESTILAMAKENLSKEEYEELEKGNKKYFILENVWSKPQNVVFVFGDSQEDLELSLQAASQEVKTHISTTDLEEFKKIAFINGINGKLSEQWKEYHQLDLSIPTDYKLAENEGNFVSLRKDIEKGMIFIFFDVIYYDGEIPSFNNGIELRNERGHFVSSNAPNSYMSTDSTLGFLETKTIKNDKIIYETSGLWTMVNDFMGGPFINQYIIDQANHRVILLDGFIYAPGENKKKRYLRQIEAIFSTLKL